MIIGSTGDPAPRGNGALLPVLAALLLVGLGLALRITHARALGSEVFEWEADLVIQTWEGRPWGAWNRLRVPGGPILLAALWERMPGAGVPPLRLVCVGLSVLGLAAALELARQVSLRSGLERRSVLRGVVWASVVWAIHPTLIRTAVSPSPELLTAPAVCFLLGRLVAGCRPGPAGWWDRLLLLVGAAVATAFGGVLLGLAVLLGVLVYLLPLPRLSIALQALALLAVVGSCLWWIQRGPDPTRRWLPDTAPVHSLLALLDAPPAHPNDLPCHADRREEFHLSRLREAWSTADGLAVMGRLADRLRQDALGPARLEPLISWWNPEASSAGGTLRPGTRELGWFDLFLRGGCLLFACAILRTLARPPAQACLPRAALVVGLLGWTVLGISAGVGPFVVAPLDLALLGLAAGGVAGADPRRAWTRRIAFAMGGLLLCTLLFTAGVRPLPMTDWTRRLTHGQGEGAFLVGLLADPEASPPAGAPAARQEQIANLLMQPGLPFLRLPEAAAAHALAATMLTPDADTALELLARAHVEAGEFRQAALAVEMGLALQSRESFGQRRMELLLDWVRQEERLAAGLPSGR